MAKEFDRSGIGQAFKGITAAIIDRAHQEAGQDCNGTDEREQFINALQSGNRYFYMHKLCKHMYLDNPEKVSRYLRMLCTAKAWPIIANHDRRLWFFISGEIKTWLRRHRYTVTFEDDQTISVVHADGSRHYGDPSKKITEIWSISY